jgi:hypothetical protein
MRKIAVACGMGALTALALACDDGAADRIDNRWDCRQICDRFAECFTDEDDYDVGDCTDQCSDNSVDDDFEAKAEDCESCLDNRDSCAEDTVQCADECTGVVAQSQ